MKKVFYVALSLIGFSCIGDKKQNIGYSGEDISESYSIIRDKNTKEATIQIKKDGQWKLYAGKSTDSIDLSAPIAEGKISGKYLIPVSDSVRNYFFLKTDEGTAILAERHLPMAGGHNFRDMGGIRNKEGRYVKWGKVFRSDDLHKLTDADLFYLDRIPLRSLVDFRSPPEIEQAPDRTPLSASAYKLPITPGSLSAATIEDVADMSPGKAIEFMKDLNKSFSTDPEIIGQYRTFFQMLQDETKLPLMFHCSAGKDRTGMAGALFLYSLGVDDETIMNDYLSSNIYLRDKYAEHIAQHPQLKPMFEVKKEFIQAGIDQIKQEYSSVENYLKNVLGVDLNKMKEMYLYK